MSKAINSIWYLKWSMDAANRIKAMQLCSGMIEVVDRLVQERDFLALRKLESDILLSFSAK